MHRPSPPPAAERTIQRRDVRTAFLVAALLFACYLLTFTGLIQSSDGLAMFATTESIVRRGEADTNQILWMGLQQGSFGPDGELYSRKGLGMTLLALPLVWLARLWPAVGLSHAALLLNPLLTGWTGGLLYLAVIRLGWSRFSGFATALAFGLATLAWPYTQTFFSDPMAGWGLFVALYWLLAFQQKRRKRILLWAGLAWGLAYLSRSVNLVTLPVYALALAALLLDGKGLGIGEWRVGRRLPTLHSPISNLLLPFWREWTLFAAPILLCGLLSLWWNWLRFGSALDSGYVESEAFNGDWLFGLMGLLISPGRGLLWYSPVLLLFPLGVGWFWRRARWLLLSSAGIALLYWLLYAKWYMWHGGYSWGPRFLVPVLPFLMLLTAPAWQWIFAEERWGRPARLLTTGLVLLSLAVQWLGMLVPFSLVQDWLDRTVQPLFAPETFVWPAYSPLLRQWDFLNADSIIFAWWRLGRNGPDFLALGLLLAALAGGALLLLRGLRPDEEEAAESENLPVALYAGALLLVTLVLLVRFQTPSAGAENRAIAQRIAAAEAPGDAILHLRPLETQHFANAYHGRLPVYGLFPVDELSAPNSRLLDDLLQRYHRLWVLPDFAPPEQSGWERSLRGTVFLLSDERIPPDDRRLVLYAAAQEQPLTERGVVIRFGEPAWVRLNGYGLPEEVTPGSSLLVALEWESLRPVEQDYRVFVHLLDGAGAKLAQRDGQPVLWLRPTSGWQPGERIVDRYGLLLPADLPPGEYRVAVGLYDPNSGERQPSSAGPGDFAIQLGPVRVVGRSPSPP